MRTHDFLEAIEQGDLKRVRQGIEDGECDLNEEHWGLARFGDQPITPLILAIHTKNLKAVQLLAEHGANVNHHDSRSQTPLCHAAEWGTLPIVKYLLAQGTSLKTDRGRSVLDGAFLHMNWEEQEKIAVYLLEQGAELTTYSDNSSEHLLRHTATLGHLKVARYFWDQGVRTNFNERYGDELFFPLLWAASHGHKDAVDFMLERGADPEVEQNGYRALECALRNGYEDVADLLRPVTKPPIRKLPPKKPPRDFNQFNEWELKRVRHETSKLDDQMLSELDWSDMKEELKRKEKE